MLVIVLYLSVITLYGQSNLNAYKYVTVPDKFSFQKNKDEYQLNSLTKFLFDKEGFVVLSDSDNVPEALYKNSCLGLKVNVTDQSTMFSSKVTIELFDCRNVKFLISPEGKSKQKDFKKGYQEALRKAFQSIKSLNYAYDSSVSIEKEILEKPDNKVIIPVIVDKPSDTKMTNAPEEKLLLDETETVMEVELEDVSKVSTQSIGIVSAIPTVLYAQDKSYGYQLVDSAPSVVYLLQKTSLKDVYILKNKNGIVYKKNDIWMAEYYENDELIQNELTIKF